jgi:CO/xanthine dehydrogenase FAD-binding subunit
MEEVGAMTLTFGREAEAPTPMSAVSSPSPGVHTARASRGGEPRRHGDAGFDYVRVHSYDQAVAALTEYGEGAKVIAGGQSLVPMVNLRLVRPTVLIDVNGIDPERPYVEYDHLVIPAMTRHSQLLASPVVQSHCPLLAQAVAHVGNVRVRNRGTLGGSLAQGEATAEIGAVALALDGEITAYGPQGHRIMRSEDFFLGFLTTALGLEELVTGLRLPLAGPKRGWSFHEMTRRVGGMAIVGVAATVELAPDAEVVRSVRVSLIGVAERPVIGEPGATSSLLGEVPSAAHLDAVAAAVAAATRPRDDVLASGSYRSRLARVLTRRALTEALLGAGGRIAAA